MKIEHDSQFSKTVKMHFLSHTADSERNFTQYSETGKQKWFFVLKYTWYMYGGNFLAVYDMQSLKVTTGWALSTKITQHKISSFFHGTGYCQFQIYPWICDFSKKKKKKKTSHLMFCRLTALTCSIFMKLSLRAKFLIILE